MPADPLTGILGTEDEQIARDYLGRDVQVSTRGSTTVPVGGAPVTGGAGPVAPGGTGVGPAFTGGGSARGTRPAGDEVTGRIASLGQKALEQLRRAGAFADSLSGARNPETEQAFQAQRAGERAGLAGAGAEPATLAALRAGASPTTITGEFSPEIQALFGAGGAGATGAAAIPAELGGVGVPVGLGIGGQGAGAGAGAAGAAAAGGAEAGAGAGAGVELGALLGPAGLLAGGILSILNSTVIEPSQTPYRSARAKAYSLLGQQVEGGFAPKLQEAVGKGPEAVQKLLTPENLKEFGLEVQQDPSGQYTVGLSSAGHPYIKYSDALNAQTQLTQAVNQALQISRAFQLLQQPAEAPAPAPAAVPPTTPGGGPLGLAEIGLEVGQ